MIRRAHQEDEANLESLCKSVDEDDYVLHFLSSWLQEGSIYVYEKESLVGMIRLTYLRDHKAHLGAVRVHPAFRRHGVATQLSEHCIAICGASLARLAIMDKEASQAVAKKIGFEHVATFTFLKRPVSDCPPVQCEKGDVEEALSLVRHSPLFKKSHWLLPTSFMFYEPSPENSKGLVTFIHGDNVALLDFEIEEAPSKTAQIAYCDPDLVLLESILHEAKKSGMQEIWAVIPQDHILMNFFKERGFESVEWGKTIRVFELRIKASDNPV